MGLNVFGSAPAGLTAFKEGGDDFHLVDHVGKHAIFQVMGPEEVNTAKYGLKTAVKAEVAVLDGSDVIEFADVLIFNAAPVSQLKGLAGQTTVALIEQYETKQGNMAPRLAEPTPAAIAAAEAHLKKKGGAEPPF